MKTYRYLILLIFIGLAGSLTDRLYAQCATPNTIQNPSSAVNVGTGNLVTISNSQKEREYAQITGIVSGRSYLFTYSRAASIMTIRVGSYNGTVLGSGSSSVLVTATSSADLYVHYNTSSCGTNGNNRTSGVQAVPVITSLGSASGCAGTSITINGANFTGVTAADVRIGGTAVSSITSSTSTQIIAVIGSGTTGNVTVTNSAGTGTSSSTFTVGAAPSNRTVTAPGATICTGSSVNISVASSQVGVNYQLRNDATNALVGSAVAGTGGTITLPTGALATTTTFNVLATNASSGCTLEMANTPTINVSGPTVNAGSSVTMCESTSPSAITLSGASFGGSASSAAWSITSGSGTLSSTAYTANPAVVTFTPALGYSGTVVLTLTTNAPGSCSAVSSTKTIRINPLPNVAITADHCIGGGVIRLTASGASTYLWNTGQTSTSIDVLTAGNYTVTGTSAAGCVSSANYLTGTELVTNGDFDLGNTGFTTNYTYTADIAGNTELYPEGYYGVGTNANNYHTAFNGTDHTSGSGNFMIVNGIVTPDRIVWSQNGITVTPNTTYYFSAWGLTLVAGNNAILQFSINGTQVGTTATLPDGYTSTSGPYNWVRFFGSWNSGSSTTANLSIVNNQLAAGGNDFGLDDISFSSLPPVTLAVTAAGSSPTCASGTLTLTPTVTGGNYPLTYAWSGPSSYSSSSQTPAISGLTAANSGVYTVTVTDSYGCTASGSTSSITVNPLPTITLATSAAARCFASTSQTSSVTYSATSGTPTSYTLVWDATANLAGLVNVASTALTAGSITVPIAANVAAGTYNGAIYVTNANGCTSVANNFTLTINALPVMTSANSGSICSGSTLSFGLTSSIASTYSWQAASNTNVTGESTTAQSGSTINNTLTNTSGSNQNVVYSVIPTATASGCVGSSQTVTITVQLVISNNTISSAQTICSGTTAAAMTGTTATGGSGSMTYLWERSITSSSSGFSAAPGTNNASGYTPGTLTQTIWLRRVATAGACTNTSNVIQITVDPVIANNTVSSAQTICTSTTPAALTGSTPTGGTGSYTYQWQSSTTSAAAGFAAASGTNNTINYTPGSLTQTTWYRRVVTSGSCNSTSTAIQITVSSVIANNTVSSAQTICSATTPAALTGTTPTGGSGTYTYAWESSTTSAAAGFAAASGTNNTINYTPGSLTQTTWYRRVVTSGGCTSTSAAIQITVNAAIANNTVSAAQTICTATTPAALT
ncbi:MAG: hypothetical protein RLY16_241, partial [Bacteroidota bacterium]